MARMRPTTMAPSLLGERVQGIAPSTDVERGFTVTCHGRDEQRYDGFGDALGMLAIHAENGRGAGVFAPGGLLLASTDASEPGVIRLA